MSTTTGRYSATLSVKGEPAEQARALRAAAKVLLRCFGVKLVEIKPETPSTWRETPCGSFEISTSPSPNRPNGAP
jgi:hypothetical protein